MVNNDTDSRYLLTREAADLMRMKPQTLRRWRWGGGGPRYIKAGSKVLYRIQDIEAWMASRARTSTTDPGPAAEGGQR